MSNTPNTREEYCKCNFENGDIIETDANNVHTVCGKPLEMSPVPIKLQDDEK